MGSVKDVYMGSTEGALRALRKASQIISDKDIEEILEKLSKNPPSDNK
jgi:flagellin-specific chaperone FliS